MIHQQVQVIQVIINQVQLIHRSVMGLMMQWMQVLLVTLEQMPQQLQILSKNQLKQQRKQRLHWNWRMLMLFIQKTGHSLEIKLKMEAQLSIFSVSSVSFF